jgi:hypothetical protein
MADDYTATIRIRRPSKITTDERGRSVWAGEIETAELELVSTAELEQLLASSDEKSRTAIEQALAGDAEGVLARDPTTGLFQIVSEEEVAAALAKERGGAPRGRLEPVEGEELSLVSTQVLRRRLESTSPKPVRPGSPGKPARPVAASRPKRDEGGGFDPYNNA